MDHFDIDHARQRLRTVQINCIRKCIVERGVSQKWVAQRLNKTTNTLNGWCSNKVQPHLIDLYLLAAVLNCAVHDLIDDVNVHELVRAEYN